MLLRYSRDYEKQADLLGVQIMARAGYDPRALAHMFETIEKQSAARGGSGPQWMSSHPNPGNRTQYINKEAGTLTIAAAADASGFQSIKTTFASLPPAKSMADLAKAKDTGGGGPETLAAVGTPGQPVPRPSGQYRDIAGGKLFQASVPSDWTSLPSKNVIKVVPQNGYGELNGQTVFSYRIEFGIAQAASRDLQQATNAWLNAVGRTNPEMRLAGSQLTTKISGRPALGTPIVNPSPLGGQERIAVYTTFLTDSTLFYFLTVAPENDADAFRDTFKRIGESIRLAEVH